MRAVTGAFNYAPSHRNPTLALPLTRIAPVLAAIAVMGLGVAAALQMFKSPAALQLDSGIYLPQARPLPEVALTDQDGQAFGAAQWQGPWSLLFAGFTHCPDVCPTTLQMLKQLEADLQAKGLSLRPIFLSLDPQRDTPEQLQRYVRHFSPTITGITGSKAELDRLSAALGLAYVKIPGASETDYTIDHSAALVLINPQGQVAGYFQAPHKRDLLAADLQRVMGRQ